MLGTKSSAPPKIVSLLPIYQSFTQNIARVSSQPRYWHPKPSIIVSSQPAASAQSCTLFRAHYYYDIAKLLAHSLALHRHAPIMSGQTTEHHSHVEVRLRQAKESNGRLDGKGKHAPNLRRVRELDTHLIKHDLAFRQKRWVDFVV